MKWLVAIVALAVLALGVAIIVWSTKQPKAPDWVATGDGRLEADLVDIVAKEPGRLGEVQVREGDSVTLGQTLARIDDLMVKADLAKARAEVAKAESEAAQAAAQIVAQEGNLRFAKQDNIRATSLTELGSVSKRTADQRQSNLDVASATLVAAQANHSASILQAAAARAEVARIQAQLNDLTLVSPVRGRVLYRLAQPGEVLAAGGKALTVVDFEHVYMEVFLPAQEAGRVELGAKAQIVLDAFPSMPMEAKVTFVSPEAQFTPKQVETTSEREKLMFRVKVELPANLIDSKPGVVKTGLRGVAHILLDHGHSLSNLPSNLAAARK